MKIDRILDYISPEDISTVIQMESLKTGAILFAAVHKKIESLNREKDKELDKREVNQDVIVKLNIQIHALQWILNLPGAAKNYSTPKGE